jgi:hypothetical protein
MSLFTMQLNVFVAEYPVAEGLLSEGFVAEDPRIAYKCIN